MIFVFASNNAHKLAEVRPILAPIQVLSLEDIGCCIDVQETGTTLEENSMIKAQTIAQWLTAHPTHSTIDGIIADDTGLEIDALHGQPGVFTARWAGEGHRDGDNRRKALRELEGQTQRGAQFRTVITLITPHITHQLSGCVRGQIAVQEYGEGGFGYDPIFIPDGYDRTFAELSSEIKNTISHRARALQALQLFIQQSQI